LDLDASAGKQTRRRADQTTISGVVVVCRFDPPAQALAITLAVAMVLATIVMMMAVDANTDADGTDMDADNGGVARARA
jgi:hypothetical protein